MRERLLICGLTINGHAVKAGQKQNVFDKTKLAQSLKFEWNIWCTGLNLGAQIQFRLSVEADVGARIEVCVQQKYILDGSKNNKI